MKFALKCLRGTPLPRLVSRLGLPSVKIRTRHIVSTSGADHLATPRFQAGRASRTILRSKFPLGAACLHRRLQLARLLCPFHHRRSIHFRSVSFGPAFIAHLAQREKQTAPPGPSFFGQPQTTPADSRLHFIAGNHACDHVVVHMTVEHPHPGIIRNHIGRLHLGGTQGDHIGAVPVINHGVSVPVR